MAMNYNWLKNFYTNANFLLDRSMLDLQVRTPSTNSKGFAYVVEEWQRQWRLQQELGQGLGLRATDYNYLPEGNEMEAGFVWDREITSHGPKTYT